MDNIKMQNESEDIKKVKEKETCRRAFGCVEAIKTKLLVWREAEHFFLESP